MGVSITECDLQCDVSCCDTDLRVRNEDEDVLVRLEFFFEPDAGLEVEVIGRLVEEQQMRLDEERSGQGDSHAPTAGKVLAALPLHLLGEAETLEDVASLGLGHVRADVVETLVDLKICFEL